MNIKVAFALSTVPALIAIAPANASTFRFDSNNLRHNNNVGTIENITTTFNDVSNEFSWSSTFSRNTTNNLLAEGGWLVVSDGEDPKANADEYAILYLDGKNETVSFYNYDGVNSRNSYQSESYLGSTALNVTDTGSDRRTFDFSFNATDLNNNPAFSQPDWDGVAFGEEIGIWFHGTEGLTTEYRADGSLATFEANNQGWYDSSHNATTKVPEPGSIMAIGFFATAAAGLRKRFTAA